MKKQILALLMAVGLCVSGASGWDVFKDYDKFNADCKTINQHFYTCKWFKVIIPIVADFTDIEWEIMGIKYHSAYIVMRILDLLHHKNFKDYLTQDEIKRLNEFFNGLDSEVKSNLKNQPDKAHKGWLIIFNNALKEAGIGQ